MPKGSSSGWCIGRFPRGGNGKTKKKKRKTSQDPTSGLGNTGGAQFEYQVICVEMLYKGVRDCSSGMRGISFVGASGGARVRTRARIADEQFLNDSIRAGLP